MSESKVVVLPETKSGCLPGIVLLTQCPRCGRQLTQDLGRHIPYGTATIFWYCEDGCEYEWTTHAEVEIKIPFDAGEK